MEKTLKIVLKTLIIILIVILVAILCIFIRNLIIFSKIRLMGDEILKSKNYHITISTSMPDYDYSVRNEIYYKDGIQTIYTYNHDELNEQFWKDCKTEETVSYAHYGNLIYEIGYNTEIINSVEALMKLKEYSIFKNCVSNIVEVEDGCYVFKAGKNFEIYYDKKSGELLKTVTLNEDLETINSVTEYKFEVDKVTDENVAKPIVEE